MSDTAIEDFCSDYTKALNDGTAALFVGAGLSMVSGHVDWKGLLAKIAKDLELDINKETDLVAIAQFHLNKYTSRSKLNQLLIDKFTSDTQINRNHRLIAALPVRTIWTTNYDTLLEDAFRQTHKRADVKISKENLTLTVPNCTFRDFLIVRYKRSLLGVDVLAR